MTAIYGARWASSMGISPIGQDGSLTMAGDTWAQGLAGIKADMIAAGLRACLASGEGWPPTLPEFRALCVAAPSMSEVREQLRGEFENFSPFTLLVYRKLDFWNYRRADSRQAEAMLQEAYDNAKGAMLRGEPLPDVPRQVEYRPAPSAPASPDVVRNCLATIRRKLGVAR